MLSTFIKMYLELKHLLKYLYFNSKKKGKGKKNNNLLHMTSLTGTKHLIQIQILILIKKIKGKKENDIIILYLM